MAGEARQPGEGGEALRARALLALLPALVHRMNNALLVVQGVVELGTRAPQRERAEAKIELALLGRALTGLSELARPPGTSAERVEAEKLLHGCALVIEPLAAQRGFALESWAEPGLVLRAGESLAWLFLCALHERLGTGKRTERLVLAASARGQRARLSFALSAASTGEPAQAEALLGELTRAHGGTLVTRTRGRALVLRATLPLLAVGRAHERAARMRPRRVLLLAAAGEERELVSLMLVENGFRVHEAYQEPERGLFDMALVEERLTLQDPHLCARLRARFGPECVHVLEPRARPEELLARLAERS